MAYMSQEHKAELAPAIKAVLKKYKIKGTIAVRHHSELVVNIRQGDIDLIGNYIKNSGREDTKYLSVNQYSIDKDFTGEANSFLNELHAAMMNGNFDRSDLMSDYFDVGWYISINIGNWEKSYICTKEQVLG